RVSEESLIYSFLLQAICLIFLYYIYKYFTNRISYPPLTFKAKWGRALLIIQIAFIIFNTQMGVNTAGSVERIEGQSLSNYLFIILQPDILVAVISVCLNSGFLFWTNILVYLLSMFLRGWMGGTFVILFLILSRYQNLRISLKTFLVSLCSLLLLFSILPALIEAKWAMRTGISLSVFISNMSSYVTPENYYAGINYLLNRFQHVGHLALIYENADDLFKKYNAGYFSSYYMDGIPQYLLVKMYNLDMYKLSFYLVQYFFDITEPTWNINTGVVGWLYILRYESILFAFYIMLLLLIPYYVVSRFAGKRMLSVLACFSIIYLFHGWLGAYVNLAFYACIISLLANIRLYRTVYIPCEK
ncbi:O121 family O-antigen polymerase, partial [Escherichia coli]|nr:O121 family O-antigen polymerase [Escherichia coli]